MTFQEYQAKARVTALYPDKGHNLVYTTLGLVGESGEIAEKVKKIIRDKGGQIDAETKELLKKELGDVLWYIAMCCDELNLDMEDVAQTNILKLADRKERNMLHGSGDER